MSISRRQGFSLRWPDEPDRLEESAEPQLSGLAVTLQSADLIDVVAERASLGIDPVLDHLDRELVALLPVKRRVHQITDFLLVDRLRYHYGVMPPRPTLHMCFTGGPATGKTTVALRMAEILKVLGYLDRGQLVTVTGEELGGMDLGCIASRTGAVLNRALGGVLLVKAPYDIDRTAHRCGRSAAASEILVQIMDNRREEIVVILAGHKDRMDGLLRVNPDVSSRLAHRIDFPDFTADELCVIADHMLAERRYSFSPEARQAFRRYLEPRLNRPSFTNARTVSDALERVRIWHAHRIMSGGRARCSRQELMRIELDDILASTVVTGDQLLDVTSGDGATEEL